MKKTVLFMSAVLLGSTICLAQQKPAQSKKTPPKVDITKFTPPKHKKDTTRARKIKFAPPVIRKDS